MYNEHVKISNEHCILCFFFSVIRIVKSRAKNHKAHLQRFKEKNNDEYLSKERVLRRETTLLVTNISYISRFVFLIEFLCNNHIWLILRSQLLLERFRCKIYIEENTRNELTKFKNLSYFHRLQFFLNDIN